MGGTGLVTEAFLKSQQIGQIQTPGSLKDPRQQSPRAHEAQYVREEGGKWSQPSTPLNSLQSVCVLPTSWVPT